ncbi:MAG: hypothetical protein ACT4P5_06500 [Armatimonadota bacterium]
MAGRKTATGGTTMRHLRVYKAVLLISIVKRNPAKLKRLATALRNMPGVRHIEAAIFQDWVSEPPIPEPVVFRRPGKPEPWRPYGVLIHVESEKDEVLQRQIKDIFRVATKVEADPELMEINGADAW